MTPSRIGMIFTMPLPQMLQMITTTMATRATGQFVSQLEIADWDRFRPMQMMMGPVTMGGKNFMTRFAPKARNSPARTRYTRPAQATPKQA